MNSRRISRLLVLSSLLTLALLANTTHMPPFITQVHAQSTPPTSVFVTTPNGSNNFTDLASTSKSITFAVNVALSPSINAFLVFLSYNTTIFTFNNINYTDNVLGSSAQLQRFCVDGIAEPGSIPCQIPDDTGVISLALFLLGTGASAPTTTGLLFHVTFNRVGTGFGQIHILPADSKLVQAPTGSGYVPFLAGDAYYTNIACPSTSNVACRPPSVTITFSPAEPTRLSPVDLNATVVEHNSGAVVVSYRWDFGDGSPATRPANKTGTQHPFAGQCSIDGACAVTVTVSDTEHVSWKTTIVIPIRYLFIKLSVSDFNLDYKQITVSNLNYRYFVVPGTIIHITAKILNDSTLAENATLTISLERTHLNQTGFTLNPRGSQFGTSGQLNAVWDTTGYSPRSYTLNATISNIISAVKVNGAYVTGENQTISSASELNQAVYVFVIIPQSTGGLSLSLLQTTGLAVLIVVGAGAGIARFFRKPSYETEPLT